MLLTSIIIYLAITVGIGVYASRRVKSEEDFILAGRHLPMFMATATVFATWFGSETILGASAEMVENGLLGVIEDPFGAALCLILVGLFFAKPLYRRRYNTFADFYDQTFGRKAEFIASICLILSYFGWVAAQVVAMGLVLEQIAGVSLTTGIIIMTAIVVIYTYRGGMWAISITDSIQMVIIIIGLVVTVLITLSEAGGIDQVIKKAPAGHFDFLPAAKSVDIMAYIAAWLTLGSAQYHSKMFFKELWPRRMKELHRIRVLWPAFYT